MLGAMLCPQLAGSVLCADPPARPERSNHGPAEGPLPVLGGIEAFTGFGSQKETQYIDTCFENQVNDSLHKL